MLNSLCLNDWTVSHVEDKEGVRMHYASYNVDPDHCLKCGVVCRLNGHGSEVISYRDSPAYNMKTVIVATVKRYRCPECGKTFMQPLPDMDGRRQMTSRCLGYIQEEGLCDTKMAVSRQIGVDEKTVRSIVEAHVERLMAARVVVAPRILSIDELTLKHQQRTILIDLGARKVLDLLVGKGGPGLERWLRDLTNLQDIRAVTMDMCGNYRTIIKKCLPQARIIVDKFHVLRLANRALDRARNRKRKKGEKTGKRGTRIALQKSSHKLFPSQRATLEDALTNPVIAAAYNVKEGFYDIYNATDRKDAEARFDRWRASAPKNDGKDGFGSLADTVMNWHKEIFAYFDYPLTNAYTECRNRIIRDMDRASRGHSFEKTRERVLLHKSLSEYAECKCCNQMLPVSVFKTTGWDFDENGRKEVPWLCVACDYILNTVTIPKFDEIVARKKQNSTLLSA